MEAMVRNLIFCSSCDYAIDKLERDSLRCRPDAVTCPRCHAVNLTQFYSCGSQTHRDRRESWERGEINGAPLPLEIKKVRGFAIHNSTQKDKLLAEAIEQLQYYEGGQVK